VDVEFIQSCDALLTRRADRVFVAPPALLAAKQAANPAATFAPHGVDVAMFAQAQDPATAVPPPAAALGKPVIGYFGLIAAWTDIELIEWLARQRPHWQFLLVGHAKIDVGLLQRCANILLVGAQPYESLPGWAKAFDVAIIPYRMNRQVHNANPLKLREYLATGKPVVSVPTPEVDRFSEFVRVAPDREAFLAAIEDCIAEDDPLQCERRMASVRAMSWDQRVDETLRSIDEALKQARESALHCHA